MTGTKRIGLVLGAGGMTGAAFHAGALLAIEQDIGWDPRAADLIVGTSAGSIVGSLLRAGLSTDDLAAWATSVGARPDGAASRKVLDELEAAGMRIRPPRMRLPLPSLGSIAGRPLGLIAGMRRPAQRVGLHTVAMSLLPHGFIDAGSSLSRLGDLIDGWPDRDLWIAAVRVSTARRFVFGRDTRDVPLGRAVAASCAIPALFRPVRIGGHHYIDGGAHSPTNADLLVDAGIDVALVLSPMSGRAVAARRGHDRLVRSILARRLDHECAQLSRSGVEVHVIEPDRATVESMGTNALSRRRTADVVRSSFLNAGRCLLESTELTTTLRARDAAPTRDTLVSH